MVKKNVSKRKNNPAYDFHIYRCCTPQILFADSVVFVLAKSIPDAFETVPSANCVEKMKGNIIIRPDVAKDIVKLSKEKWVKS
jgi:hypothetical protein